MQGTEPLAQVMAEPAHLLRPQALPQLDPGHVLHQLRLLTLQLLPRVRARLKHLDRHMPMEHPIRRLENRRRTAVPETPTYDLPLREGPRDGVPFELPRCLRHGFLPTPRIERHQYTVTFGRTRHTSDRGASMHRRGRQRSTRMPDGLGSRSSPQTPEVRMTSKYISAAASADRSTYRSLQCDAFDRDGHRCVLPLGHDRMRGDTTQHRAVFNDEVRAWSVRMTSAETDRSRYR
jgi:hypothetical protein